jgi:hypothetical protein
MDSQFTMPRSLRLLRHTVTAIAASLVLGWTSVGESSDPVLAVDELPLEMLAQCATGAPAQPDCRPGETLVSRWVGRSERGDLFLTSAAGCVDAVCRAWLFERGAQRVAMLLALEGQVSVRAGGDYPLVEARAPLVTGETITSRYRWNGQSYERTEAELRYRVDGIECGTAAQCRQAADAALEGERVDRAVRIYERVHGVSWI